MDMFKLTCIGVTLIMLNCCASAIDKTLSPPSDTQWVNVEIKNPSPYTQPFPLEVVYLSDVCKKRYISGFDGKRVEEVSYNPINIPLQQQCNSDIYRARIAMTGGGSCQWKLSEFNLGIEYIDAKHLGQDLVPGTAVGATIAFDDIASRNGQFEDVSGDLTLAPNYYPYIREWNVSKKSKELSLLGKKSFLSYRVYNAKNILFTPKVDELKITRWIEPQEIKDGAYSKTIYPDGTEVYRSSAASDFKKVDKMKLNNKP